MGRLSLLATALVLAVAGCSSGGTTSGTTADTPTPMRSAGPASAPAAIPSETRQAPVPAEKNPPGDIPDNLAFVTYTNPVGKYRFTHPEGWAENTKASTVTFTDKLNGVQAMTGTATTAPTGPNSSTITSRPPDTIS